MRAESSDLFGMRSMSPASVEAAELVGRPSLYRRSLFLHFSRCVSLPGAVEAGCSLLLTPGTGAGDTCRRDRCEDGMRRKFTQNHGVGAALNLASCWTACVPPTR